MGFARNMQLEVEEHGVCCTIHAGQRQQFRVLYADLVEAGFDDIERWEQEAT